MSDKDYEAGALSRSIWDGRYRRIAQRGATGETDVWLERFLPLLKQAKGEPVLDLGCGEGLFSLWLLGKGFDVTACDFSSEALSLLGQKAPDMRMLCFDMALGLPFEEESFGAAIASLSTHYFSLEETRKIYAGIYRALKSGGHLFIRVNSLRELEQQSDVERPERLLEPDFYLMENGLRTRYFSPASLRALLEEAGFAALTCREAQGEYRGHTKYAVEAAAKKQLQ